MYNQNIKPTGDRANSLTLFWNVILSQHEHVTIKRPKPLALCHSGVALCGHDFVHPIVLKQVSSTYTGTCNIIWGMGYT